MQAVEEDKKRKNHQSYAPFLPGSVPNLGFGNLISDLNVPISKFNPRLLV
ncbi:hypothetical protein HanRHA438_Chr08g0340161 [Helianthus annuus]|nr:hypothetical protein HanRHA438_Chr08g0340161 [Helianthus annuus]